MPPTPLSELRSNWQFVAFYLIEPHVSETHRYFSRTAIMHNYDEIYLLLAASGHETRPRAPEQTLQRTLQNMREKGWIDFLDNRGEYKLTDEGYKTLLRLKPRIQHIRENKSKFLKKAEDILRQWEIDLEEFT